MKVTLIPHEGSGVKGPVFFRLPFLQGKGGSLPAGTVPVQGGRRGYGAEFDKGKRAN